MKKLFKILRSILASLLFLLLTATIMTQLIFTGLKLEGRNISEILDREALLKYYLPDIDDFDDIKKVAETFLEDYTNYIFHKRSYPSLQTVDYKEVNEENLSTAKEKIALLNEKLTLEYEDVILLRDANNVLSNGAIYLLINVAVFFVFIILSIVLKSFKRGAQVSSISLLLAGVSTAILIEAIFSNLPSILKMNTYNYISYIFTPRIINNMINLSFIYIAISIPLFTIIMIFEKYLSKK